MFQGVVHANARRVLASWVGKLPRHVHVIGSGNFSIETTLRANGYDGTLSGCDVSLYTSMLGAFLTDHDLELALNTEQFPELATLRHFCNSQAGRTAAVSVALDALQYHGGRNTWQRRMYAGRIGRLMELCETTMERLERKRDVMRLDEFYPLDGWDRLQSIPRSPDHAIVSFPPTYARGYERLYAKLEQAFVWSRPHFRPLTAGAEFARALASRENLWILGAEHSTVEASPDSVGRADITAELGPPVARAPRRSAVSIDLYSNLSSVAPRLIRRDSAVAVTNWPRLRDDDDILSESILALHAISLPEANYLRQVYASHAVPLVDAPLCYAVTLDGRLVGLLMFAPHVKVRAPVDDLDSGEGIYLMCDLSVASRVDRRLSKLVLHAALSSEMRDVLRERLVRRVTWVSTTVFSQHPQSMKYRGLFRRFSKKQTADKRWKLQYFARFHETTLAEEFAKWQKRYHSKTT